MANIQETAEWSDDIYLLDENDFVAGGVDGVDNRPHKELANRTAWLKAQVDELEAAINGGSGVMGEITIQRVSQFDNTLKSSTSLMFRDDTIPQKTEGYEVMSAAITPTEAANKLIIESVVNVWDADNAEQIVAALFQDEVADAISSADIYGVYNNGHFQIVMRHEMVAGTTNETTFKVRVGGTIAGLNCFNGINNARVYGGTLNSWLAIKEIKSEA